MNQLRKKIIYYYLIITSILLIAEWNIYQFIYQYSDMWSEKTGISKTIFLVSGGILVIVLFCAVSYIYYGKVNRMIINESERQVKERNIIFANISHDLKNPMASVIGYARALEEGAVQEDELNKVYKIISDKSNQMNDMILKMFQYAKMESKGYELNLVDTNICEMIRGVIIDRFDEFEEHNIKLDIDIPEYKIVQAIDVGEFTRAMNNLISNAIKHNEEGIKILIRVENSDNQKLKIIVADTGKEILETIKNDLFEPFKCSDISRTSKDGSGLGLAITRRIIELHNGKIYVDNNIIGYTKGFIIQIKNVQSSYTLHINYIPYYSLMSNTYN